VQLICNAHLLSPFAAYNTCLEIVNKIVDDRLAVRFASLNPSKVCADVHICNTPQKRDLIDLEALGKKVCDTCHEVVGKVDGILKPGNQQRDKKILGGICLAVKMFDATAYNNCLDAIDRAVTNILSGAASALEPKKFCQEVHACKPNGVGRTELKLIKVNK